MYMNRIIKGGKSFAEECKDLGLDPKRTSLHALECVKFGLNPDKTSMFALECAQQGLDPETTSFDDLRRTGSRHFQEQYQDIRV